MGAGTTRAAAKGAREQSDSSGTGSTNTIPAQANHVLRLTGIKMTIE
jgi:hypothetical protein